MGSHPLNLALRFLLELTAIAAAGYWGWHQHDGWSAILLAIGIPVALAAVWGVFNVSGDPSRSGNAPVVVPGSLRLFIELCVFSFGAWAIFDLGMGLAGIVFGSTVLAHYLISYDRIIWLLRQ